ncbi:MAG: hypothetical protein K2X87_11960 [Gemmataceae bacterium]|nr:hypothetical protein [Gemmataceae bacterium]
MDILTDSGVLIRLYHRPDPLYPVINRAVRSLRRRGDALAVGFQNLTEFWNVCTRPTTARGGLGLTFAETEHRLTQVEAGFVRLGEPPAAYPNWRQLVTTHRVQGKQVHDARLVGLMQAHGITHILTLNGPDFARYPGLVVLDPAAVNPPSVPPTP